MGFAFQFLSRVAESRLTPAGIKRIAANMQIGLTPEARLAESLIDAERATDALSVIAGLEPSPMKSDLEARAAAARARHENDRHIIERAAQGLPLSSEEEQALDSLVGKIRPEDFELAARYRDWVRGQIAAGRMDDDLKKLDKLKRDLGYGERDR